MEKATKKEIAFLILAIVMFIMSACGAVNRAQKAEESTEAIVVETTTTTEAEETTIEAQNVNAESTEKAADVEPNATIVSATSEVNIRAGKSSASTKVGTYSNGDRVYIETVETFGGIRWGKTPLGWVKMKYVELDTEAATEETEPETEATTEATEATTEAPTTAATETTEPATTAPTEAQNVNNTPKATEATQPATQTTEAPTEAATQPTVAETEPVVTECSHNWVTETTEEVGHYVAHIKCPCGAEFSSIADLESHKSAYSAAEKIASHGGYSDYAEWVVDTPASSRTYCTICGATK